MLKFPTSEDVKLFEQELIKHQQLADAFYRVNKRIEDLTADVYKLTNKIYEIEYRLNVNQKVAKQKLDWQPIETAPKTGKKVILFYLNRNNFPRTVMARWLTDDDAAEIDTDCVGLEGGWYECIDNWDDYTEVSIHEGEPTHWMPLPEQPRKD